MRTKLYIAWLFILLSSHATHTLAKSTIESSGDVLYVALPATSITTALLKGDKNSKSFILQFITTAAITLTMKDLVSRPRPDASNNYSFPSGHTSMAFSGATMLTHQYGWKAGIPSYLLAGWTGYSRVYANKHYWSDVVAGAGLALLVHDALLHRTDSQQLTPFVSEKYKGISWRYIWK